MKMITATEANRDFSKLLEKVSAGEAIGITKRGKIVATLNPARDFDSEEAEKFKQEHLARLRQQPALNVARGTRDELYD
jgi:prevent-host-death family protein